MIRTLLVAEQTTRGQHEIAFSHDSHQAVTFGYQQATDTVFGHPPPGRCQREPRGHRNHVGRHDVSDGDRIGVTVTAQSVSRCQQLAGREQAAEYAVFTFDGNVADVFLFHHVRRKVDNVRWP